MVFPFRNWSMRWADLQDRKVAILGFGREGRSVLRQWRRHFPGSRIGIFEEKQALIAPDEFCDVHPGPLDAATLSRYEYALRSPGISPYRPAIEEARQKRLKLISPGTLWFGENPDARTICITGTKGKSTTAALVAHLLRHCGQRVVLAGNIGRPLLDCDEQDVDWWVIELSSYQLADLQGSPTVSAILNLSDEHLDWHGGRENYRRDKLRLASLAGSGPLVLNRRDRILAQLGGENVRWFGGPDGWHVLEEALFFGEKRVGDEHSLGLNGIHNLENLSAALTILGCAGFMTDDPASALSGFRTLPHRLQEIGEAHGVRFVSDSLSTTPVSTLAALRAYRNHSVILLAGGMDRGLDWSGAIQQMKQFPLKAVICLPDNGPGIAKAMKEGGLSAKLGIHCASGLVEGMGMALEWGESGDVVMLSPGAPSFPQFRDYADRGEQFARLAGLA